jgi:hypothetical protein
VSVWSNINILKVVPLVDPENHLRLDPHHIYSSPVYVGPVSAPEKYHAILKFAHGFLRYPDPFCLAIDGEDAHVKALGALSSAASAAGSPSSQPVADGSRDNGTGGKTPYAGRGKHK